VLTSDSIRNQYIVYPLLKNAGDMVHNDRNCNKPPCNIVRNRDRRMISTMTRNSVVLGRDVFVHPTAKITGEDIEIGDFSKIGPNAIISGRSIKIGREAWVGDNAIVGGGRAEIGSLEVGDFLHLGIRAQINLANTVVIGHEVGIGMNGMVFSHGAYLSEYDGFPYQDAPVRIGSNVWMPYAMVTPNVTIGNNVVIAAMSLVNKDLPPGCFAGGVPVRILKENVFPRKLSTEEKVHMLDKIIAEAQFYKVPASHDEKGETVVVNNTVFDIPRRKIEGPSSSNTERVKDLLRRHGIRFRFYSDGERYREWD
jgi:acetyltransferase-like isoleucine patch superfamily enzyme